jgi:hypothetical protein
VLYKASACVYLQVAPPELNKCNSTFAIDISPRWGCK